MTSLATRHCGCATRSADGPRPSDRQRPHPTRPTTGTSAPVTPLAAGDKVELFAVAEVEAGLASVPPDAEADLEVARLRLDRLMAATPEPVPAQP